MADFSNEWQNKDLVESNMKLSEPSPSNEIDHQYRVSFGGRAISCGKCAAAVMRFVAAAFILIGGFTVADADKIIRFDRRNIAVADDDDDEEIAVALLTTGVGTRHGALTTTTPVGVGPITRRLIDSLAGTEHNMTEAESAATEVDWSRVAAAGLIPVAGMMQGRVGVAILECDDEEEDVGMKL